MLLSIDVLRFLPGILMDSQFIETFLAALAEGFSERLAPAGAPLGGVIRTSYRLGSAYPSSP